MNQDDERVRDDLAAYALGALEPSERRRVETALGADHEAVALLNDYATVRDLLPFGLAPQTAPPEARARLLARARGEAVRERRPHASMRQRLWNRLTAVRLVAVAAALVAAVIWNVQLQQQVTSLQYASDVDRRARATDTPGIVLAGTGMQGAAAHLYLTEGTDQAELAVSGLPPLQPDRTYQLWFARPGQPTQTGGAFRVSAGGQAIIPVVIPVPLDQVSAIAVTEEPMPASLRPTGQHLLDGRP